MPELRRHEDGVLEVDLVAVHVDEDVLVRAGRKPGVDLGDKALAGPGVRCTAVPGLEDRVERPVQHAEFLELRHLQRVILG